MPSRQSVNQIVAGSIAGIAAVACGQPFDMVKTRMQRFPSHYRTIWQSTQLIASQEGARAFYVGSSSPLVGSAFSQAL